MALSLCRSILRRVISGIANAQFKICGKERRSLLYVKFPAFAVGVRKITNSSICIDSALVHI